MSGDGAKVVAIGRLGGCEDAADDPTSRMRGRESDEGEDGAVLDGAGWGRGRGERAMAVVFAQVLLSLLWNGPHVSLHSATASARQLLLCISPQFRLGPSLLRSPSRLYAAQHQHNGPQVNNPNPAYSAHQAPRSLTPRCPTRAV